MIKLFMRHLPLVALGVVLAALVELAAADVLYIPQSSLVGPEDSWGVDVATEHRLDWPGWEADVGVRRVFGELGPSDWEALIRNHAVASDPTEVFEPASGLKHDLLEGASFLGATTWARRDESDDFSESGLITDPTQRKISVEIRVDSFGVDGGLGGGSAVAHPRDSSNVNSGVTNNVGTMTRSLVGRAPSSWERTTLGSELAERYYLDWPWSTHPGRNMFAWVIGPPAIVFLAVVTMAVFYKASRGPGG